MRTVRTHNISQNPEVELEQTYTILDIQMLKDQVYACYIENDLFNNKIKFKFRLFEIGEPLDEGYVPAKVLQDSMGRFWVVCYKIGD